MKNGIYATSLVGSKEGNVKKRGFFKRWVAKLFNEAWDDAQENQNVLVREKPSIDNPDRALNFVIYSANGGRIVETRRYDRKTDRSHQNLYIITPEQDFGKEIDKIITMESLR